mmetsp:Transcript_14517/g.26035  ORF Transcript_14517/g.26035 Transcript_14517/m.26035 type:complete len:158 (-) Transcript_14517:213-686(-)
MSVQHESFMGGRCYCGGVSFKVKVVDPASDTHKLKTTSCFCYCESCKRAHASPLYHVVYTPKEYIEVLSGQDLIQEYHTAAMMRSFCKTCGSRLFNISKDGDTERRGFFPSLFSPEDQANLPAQFRAQYVFCPEERTLDLDHLCKLSQPESEKDNAH